MGGNGRTDDCPTGGRPGRGCAGMTVLGVVVCKFSVACINSTVTVIGLLVLKLEGSKGGYSSKNGLCIRVLMSITLVL